MKTVLMEWTLWLKGSKADNEPTRNVPVRLSHKNVSRWLWDFWCDRCWRKDSKEVRLGLLMNIRNGPVKHLSLFHEEKHSANAIKSQWLWLEFMSMWKEKDVISETFSLIFSYSERRFLVWLSHFCLLSRYLWPASWQMWHGRKSDVRDCAFFMWNAGVIRARKVIWGDTNRWNKSVVGCSIAYGIRKKSVKVHLTILNVRWNRFQKFNKSEWSSKNYYCFGDWKIIKTHDQPENKSELMHQCHAWVQKIAMQ